MGFWIFPEKKKWYLKEPDNEIDRRIYRYYEVYRRVFWLIYKKVGVIRYYEVDDCKNVDKLLTAKFGPGGTTS